MDKWNNDVHDERGRQVLGRCREKGEKVISLSAGIGEGGRELR